MRSLKRRKGGGGERGRVKEKSARPFEPSFAMLFGTRCEESKRGAIDAIVTPNRHRRFAAGAPPSYERWELGL